MKRNLFGLKEADAKFDKTGLYRYSLMRTWNDTESAILWVMLNPSTADETKLDPTLRRCRNFSREWGYGSFYVANIYAFRATNPEKLLTIEDPVGPRNDQWIRRLATRCKTVVVGWGAHKMTKKNERAAKVLETLALLGKVWCLGKTSDGSPRHPLYVTAMQKLEVFAEKRKCPSPEKKIQL